MNSKTHRAGALASAFMLVATLFAATGSGASAQSEETVVQLPDMAATTVAAEPSEALPRFVSEPVVQELPEEPDLPASAPSAASLQDLVDNFPIAEASRDVECLAEAVYFESRGEPLSGQLAVAQVIINRSQSPLFPSDYCGVITQRAQFSFVRGGRIPAAPRASQAWKRASAIAQIAHQSLWESEAKDALFFHARYVQPSWARTKLARATIDSHIFYR